MKKVYNVIETVNEDGNVEVSVKTFASELNAAQFVNSEYLSYKSTLTSEGETLDMDYTETNNNDDVDFFHIEQDNYWVTGQIFENRIHD